MAELEPGALFERNEIFDDLVLTEHKPYKVILTHQMPPGAWHSVACVATLKESDTLDILVIVREVARDGR